jgi:sugar/nucleoside kinase (ribokinase family)
MTLAMREQASCHYDVVTLGECMIRLSPPGHERLEFTRHLEVWVGGGEYNVSYALARLGLSTGWVGGLPQNPLGQLILNHGRAVGVDMGHRLAPQCHHVRSGPFSHLANSSWRD